ncbi:MAG: septum formation family protein [Actinoallomurus sp.]
MADDKGTNESGRHGQAGRLVRLFEQPFIVQIAGGVLASALTASALFLWRTAVVDAAVFALVIGFITLVCSLVLLVRFRSKLRTSQYTIFVALTAAGFSVAGATAQSQLNGHNVKTAASPHRLPARPPSTGHPSLPTSGRPTSIYNFHVGDCVIIKHDNGASSHAAASVDCSSLHDGEILFTGDAWPLTAAFPGSSSIKKQANTRCIQEFSSYVGITFAKSIYKFHYWYPSQNPWQEYGDRKMVCMAKFEKPIDYSVKGTAS